jgi:hypothetical protein
MRIVGAAASSLAFKTMLAVGVVDYSPIPEQDNMTVGATTAA